MSRRQSKPRHDRMTQTFTFFDYEDVAYNALTETLLVLDPSASVMGIYSAQLANLFDMYRFCKIDRFVMEMDCNTNVLFNAYNSGSWQGWILSYVPPGAISPANLLGIETEHAVLGSGCGGSHWSRVKLDMKASDFAVLADAGPGPGWLPTQNDGPATSFGSIQVTSTNPAGSVSATNINFSWKISITMSFDQLLDPNTISLRLKDRKEPVPRSLKKKVQSAAENGSTVESSTTTVPCSWQGVTCACKNCDHSVAEKR